MEAEADTGQEGMTTIPTTTYLVRYRNLVTGEIGEVDMVTTHGTMDEMWFRDAARRTVSTRRSLRWHEFEIESVGGGIQ